MLAEGQRPAAAAGGGAGGGFLHSFELELAELPGQAEVRSLTLTLTCRLAWLAWHRPRRVCLPGFESFMYYIIMLLYVCRRRSPCCWRLLSLILID